MALSVEWAVTVDGVNATSAMNPFIKAIEITDRDGTASDTARLVFADPDGICFLPRDGAFVEIYVQGAMLFAGTVDDVRSRGGRGSGRELAVSAKGFDSRGKVKESQRFHMDGVKLPDFLSEAARRAGLAGVTVDPAFANVARQFWAADGETVLHLGQRLARELGGTFKIRGDKAVLARRGAGLSPGGQALPVVRAQWGENLLAWDLAPFTGRQRFTSARVKYFDRAEAKWKEEEVGIAAKEGAPEAVDAVRFSKADADAAKGVAQGRKTDSEREGGGGKVELLLAVDARAEGTCVVSGARPGVDGTYAITGVTHKIDKKGASSSLELKQPQGEAGTDARPTERRDPA